jgi:hypothetical protein
MPINSMFILLRPNSGLVPRREQLLLVIIQPSVDEAFSVPIVATAE